MFQSILTFEEGTLSVQSALMCVAAALVLGLVIAFMYTKTADRYTKGFVVTVALLPALVEMIILMTSGNLGTAVAIVGAFSLVRFRSVPGTSKEILSIFFAMAVGLACGMGQIVFAAIFTLIIVIAFFLLMTSPLGNRDKAQKQLKVTIPEDLDYTGIFDDIFQKYTTKATLTKVRTVNLGSMYELDYDIILRDEKQEKAMIDEIRVRNGNLSIICGRIADPVEAL